MNIKNRKKFWNWVMLLTALPAKEQATNPKIAPMVNNHDAAPKDPGADGVPLERDINERLGRKTEAVQKIVDKYAA